MQSLPIKFGVGKNGDIEINSSLFIRDSCAAANLILDDPSKESIIRTPVNAFNTVNIRAGAAGPAFSVYQGAAGQNIAEFSASSSATTPVVINSSGYLGIGTSTATERLDVRGNILATGAVTAASFAGNGAALTGFSASARIDTTNAANITSGTIARERLPAIMNPTNFIGGLAVRPVQMPIAAFSGYVSSTAADSMTYRVSASYDSPSAPAWYAFQDAKAPAKPAWTTPAEYNPDYNNIFTGPIETRDTVTGKRYKGHWIQLQLPYAVHIYGYKLRLADCSWAMFGSLNSADWTLLDAQSAGSGTFVLKNTPTRAYNHYRLVITALASPPSAAPTIATVNHFSVLVNQNAPYSGFDLRGPLTVSPLLTTPAFVVTHNNQIGIGTSQPTAALDIASGSLRIRDLAAAGGVDRPLYVNQQGKIGFYEPDSTNAKDIEYGLKETLLLRPKDIGLIPQEVREIIPEAALDSGRLIPVLIRAIQELSEKVNSTSADAVVTYNSNIEARLANIEKSIKNINIDLDQLFAFNARL